MKVVCNTSPLILLAKIDRLELLTHLYDEVLIPVAVRKEIVAKPSEEAKTLQALLQKGAFHLGEAAGSVLEGIPEDLGEGEREAIALALERGADLVILDDRQGRRVAGLRGLATTGTIGVLIEARERGVIHSLGHELDRLIEAGIWIDERFYHRLLQEYSE